MFFVILVIGCFVAILPAQAGVDATECILTVGSGVYSNTSCVIVEFEYPSNSVMTALQVATALAPSDYSRPFEPGEILGSEKSANGELPKWRRYYIVLVPIGPAYFRVTYRTSSPPVPNIRAAGLGIFHKIVYPPMDL